MTKNSTATPVQQMVQVTWELVEARIPIVLLQHGLKAPSKGPDGSWLVVTEPSQVQHAFETASTNGLINVGAVLFPKLGSFLLAVDVDGEAAWPRLRELGLDSNSDVWIVQTGRGHFHVYFYADETTLKRVTRASQLPVDLLCDGYAVLPPSSTYREPKGGGPYAWVKGHSPWDIPLAELSPLPPGLMQWWLECASDRESPSSAQGEIGSDRAGIKAWNLLNSAIPEGRRNDSLARIAGWLHLFHPPPVVEALLLVVNEARCQPPLEGYTVKAIVRSIAKYPQTGVNGHPRGAVPRYVREEKTDV